ncbi:Methylated-DNA--protein-cysteine methyltransferase [Phycisphaerales bacterium]|nr:Methylated-DNA--protein-cysteine methyltransferase [Phycisphaerales bacterium]
MAPSTQLLACVMESPIGPLAVAADGEGVRAVEFSDASDPAAALSELSRRLAREVTLAHSGLAHACAAELREYFAGARREFSIPLAPRGTDFQRRVWSALAAIPIGTTRSYGDVAREVADLSAVRAVGAANGANPIAIIIPCHRVIASDGTLHGYGGGLHRKRWLLDHERAMAGATLFAAQGGHA